MGISNVLCLLTLLRNERKSQWKKEKKRKKIIKWWKIAITLTNACIDKALFSIGAMRYMRHVSFYGASCVYIFNDVVFWFNFLNCSYLSYFTTNAEIWENFLKKASVTRCNRAAWADIRENTDLARFLSYSAAEEVHSTRIKIDISSCSCTAHCVRYLDVFFLALACTQRN